MTESNPKVFVFCYWQNLPISEHHVNRAIYLWLDPDGQGFYYRTKNGNSFRRSIFALISNVGNVEKFKFSKCMAHEWIKPVMTIPAWFWEKLSSLWQISSTDLLEMIKEMMGNRLEIDISPSTRKAHYRITPYNFSPKLGLKMTNNPHIDMGQGLLQCISEIYEQIHQEKSHPPLKLWPNEISAQEMGWEIFDRWG